MSAATIRDSRGQSWVRAWETPRPAGPVTRTGVGPWDEVTRGFWDGGARLEAWELRPGDVFRWRTLSGYVVDRVERGAYGNATTILAYVNGRIVPMTMSSGEPLELDTSD